MKTTEEALADLAKIPRLKLLPHLIGTGLPWADKHDYGNSVSASERENATIEEVPISKLHAVQSGVKPQEVQAFIEHPTALEKPGRRSPNGYLTDLPIVVSCRGKLYLHDGHHRTVAQKLMGAKTIRARVVTVSPGSKIKKWSASKVYAGESST